MTDAHSNGARGTKGINRGWGGRVFDIEFSKSGRTEGPLSIRGGCAFVLKIACFLTGLAL